MNSVGTNDYDRVAYPSMAHPQTFAEFLSIKGFLRGLDVAPPENCRVLELGCGDGFSLAAMAEVYPDSSYTGVDLSADAIGRGRRLVADLGLEQVHLETTDIRSLGTLASDLGEFDYIIAHGVYSWVPPDVRESLLATIGRRLAPHGVAFVSYLALPGAHMRELVRTIIRFHTRGTSDPREQVQQSRSILNLIAKGSLESNHYTQWVADELATINQHADEALFHDELSGISAPLLFTEFISHAAAHGLQFLSEAEYLLPVSRALNDEAREELRPLEANRVLLEQYLDFMEGRRFRQTLLCRNGLGEKLAADRLDQLWVSCRAAPSGNETSITASPPIEFFGRKNSILRATTPATKAALLELSSRRGEAMPFPEVLNATRSRLLRENLPVDADFDTTMRLFFCRACLPGLVEFSWARQPYTITVPTRPQAHPLALWLLAHGAPSVFSYTGRFVELNDALGRHLLSLLDGTRNHTVLVAEIRAFLAEQHAAAHARGESIKFPAADDPEIPAQLERGLTGLAGLGLFRRSETN